MVPLKLEGLGSFDPFTDAVPEAFEGSPVRVDCKEAVSVELKGQPFELEGGVNEVPAYVAVHLVCRNLASIDNGHTKYLPA